MTTNALSEDREPLPPQRGVRPRSVRTANRIDFHVGARLRERRHELGMSQERLADMLGVAFQQVQKYERGVNRISASRLYQIAAALEVPIGYFFEGVAAFEGTEPA